MITRLSDYITISLYERGSYSKRYKRFKIRLSRPIYQDILSRFNKDDSCRAHHTNGYYLHWYDPLIRLSHPDNTIHNGRNSTLQEIIDYKMNKSKSVSLSKRVDDEWSMADEG